MQQVAAAEARAAAAEERAAEARAAAAKARAEAAEERAAAEARAAAAAEERGGSASGTTPSWLELLASGEFDPLGDVEVLSALSEAAARARTSAESAEDLGEITAGAGESPGAVAKEQAVQGKLLLDSAAKRAWLKELDVTMWGRAAMALSEAASEAAGMAELVAMCDSGDDVSCRILAEQEEDTAAWLDKIAVPNWGAAAAVLSVAASDAASVSASALEALEAYGFLKNRHVPSIRADRRGGAHDES